MMRIKKYKIFILMLVSFLLVNQQDVFAGIPKADIGKTAGDIVETVGNFARQVGEKLKDVQNKLMSKLVGKIAEAKAFAAEQQAKYATQIAQANAYKNAAEDAKDKAEDFAEKNKEYAEYAAARQQKASIESAYEASVEEAESTYQAEIQKIDENIAQYNTELAKSGVSESQKKALEDAIVDLNLLKKDVAEQKESTISALFNEKEASLVPVNETISALEDKMKNKGTDWLNEQGDKYSEEAGKAIEEAKAKAFVKVESTETIAGVKENRRKSYTQDLTASLSDAIRVLNQANEQNVKVSDPDSGISGGMFLSQGIAPAASTSNNVKTEQIRALMSYNKLLIQQLKLKTSKYLAESSIYQMNEAEDLEGFSLDDYNYAQKCKGVE
ncbi:MAG: hypothetical protein PHE89_02320 [Alphaproteobacteria bacterium]|nr:hypothetical protein [Alphaproteobacteria bacterium]